MNRFERRPEWAILSGMYAPVASLPDPLAPLSAASCSAEPCLFLECGPDGWAGLFCRQGREDAEETVAYLNRHYPDGLARLRPLGDLLALGGAPSRCETMDADGEYAPARHADYPPEPEPELRAACAAWNAIKTLSYACLYRPGEGWTAADAWGQPPE